MRSTAMIDSLVRGVRMLATRRIYIFAMVVVPLAASLLLLSLMDGGLPLRAPAAIVDLDHSSLSRRVTRNLNAGELLDISYSFNSYDEAMASVRRGQIMGFFVIPPDFEREVLASRQPTLSLYTNMAFFVPGTLSFKGFKTVAVTTSGGVVLTTLVSAGAPEEMVSDLIQPVSIQCNPIGNPWTNYNIYLSNSFLPGLLQLMIMLMTVFTISSEIKHGTSVEWLRTGGNSIIRAVAGKLLPQTLVFFVVGIAIDSLMFGYNHFPMNGSWVSMITAMLLLVVASQALGLFFVSVVPNPRMALSVTSLVGILTFSLAAFSYPVQSMYGALAIFSYILPVRYYFLIYINEALNGVSLYYSRYWFAALLVFPLVASTMLWRLKRACLRPVYLP